MGKTNTEECPYGNTAVMLYPPHPNELLSSWIIRNSIVQGSDPMGWIYGFWGEWRAWTRDIDRYLPKLKTVELARFSRLNTEDIYNMTLSPIITPIEGNTPDVNKTWKWIIPTGKRNRSVVSGLQFCPKCLEEKQLFFPRYWRISWHTQCSRHKIQLFDKCNQCAMPFSPHLIDFSTPEVYLCPRCGHDLRKTKSCPSPQEVLYFQNLLDAILWDSSNIEKNYPRWNIQTIGDFFLFLRDLLVLSGIISRKEARYTRWQLLLFGKPRFKKLSAKAGQTFDMRIIEERASLLYIASHILNHDPAYFAKSLHHIHLTQTILRERNFPKSTLMHRLLSELPASSTVQHKQISKKFFSKEPRTAAEVEDDMASIRRFL